jgi:peptidoglycan/LPS O-acetylase OafA/YrhL
VLAIAPRVSSDLKPTALPESAKPRRHARGDVEGLRATAIGLVLLYHAGVPFVPGGYVGVDVFLVISGFLITSQLVSELDATGRISLSGFYARRAKRLLPAAGVVLAATVVLVRLFLPKLRWSEIGADIVSSSLYFVNWRLAQRSVDYLAEDLAASPVQHFWSLAVEEQYYLVWPLLICVAAYVARVAQQKVRSVLWASCIAAAGFSFVWSLEKTARAPEQAFFVTTTRVWELAIGAAIALGASAFPRLPRRYAIVLGWAGLTAIICSALMFTGRTAWPGYAAALPTLGTAAVLVAGFVPTRGGPGAALGLAPLRWLGGLSYSLYLWHWPLLVVLTARAGELSALARLAIIGASVVLAWITSRAIENPLRYSTAISHSPKLALTLGASFTLVGLLAGFSLSHGLPDTEARSDAAVRRSALGAAALPAQPRDAAMGAPVDRVSWMTPEPRQATADVPDVYRRGCQQNTERSAVLSCEYGERRSQTRLALVGDSKIAQWLPALQRLAHQNDWHITAYTKSACSFSAARTELKGQPYTSCEEWNHAVLDRLLAEPPHFVLTSQGSAVALDETGQPSVEAMALGLRTSWSVLTGKGSRVIVIADNPHPGLNVYECVELHRDQLSACTYPRARYAESAAPTQHLAVRGQAGVAIVDLFDAICPGEQCVPVIGNVLVYRQGSHLTATYVETLAPRLARALSSVGLPAQLIELDPPEPSP